MLENPTNSCNSYHPLLLLQTTPTCIDEPVQPPHEDGATGVQAGGGAADGVAVGESPRDDLHLLVMDTPTGDLHRGREREKDERRERRDKEMKM